MDEARNKAFLLQRLAQEELKDEHAIEASQSQVLQDLILVHLEHAGGETFNRSLQPLKDRLRGEPKDAEAVEPARPKKSQHLTPLEHTRDAPNSSVEQLKEVCSELEAWASVVVNNSDVSEVAEEAEASENVNAAKLNLDDLIEDFKKTYENLNETHKNRMKDMVSILNEEFVELLIRHPPIAYRWKTMDSAVASIKRRHKERANRGLLKRLLGMKDEEWIEYCRMSGEKEGKAAETEPFKTAQEAYDAVHDLAGLRVSLYFPGDVVKVKDFLERQQGLASKNIEWVRTIHKTDRDPRFPSLQKRLDDEREKQSRILNDKGKGTPA
jgi:polyhydroxyalkanoate synthesis regulator phasin